MCFVVKDIGLNGWGTPNGLSGCSIPALLSWFFTTFLINCFNAENLMITTCLKTVVGVNKGMLPVIHFCSNKASFVSVEFHGDHKNVMKLR